MPAKMAPPSKPKSAMNVSEIADTLPSANRPYRRNLQKPSQPMPATLPPCFAEVWRRRQSALPAHRRERATLEAVASTIPEHARSATGAAAAGVYLAALIMALKRIVETTSPVAASELSELALPATGKKARRKQRRLEREAEATVKGMATAELLAGTQEKADQSEDMLDKANDEDAEPDADGNVELIASLVYLIGLAVGSSSQPVLNSQCEHVLGVVMAAHDHVAGRDIVLRHSSVVYTGVLAVLDSVAWSRPVVQRAYLYLLSATWNGDGKARRKAREALEALLRCPRAPIVLAKTSVSASGQLVAELKMQGNAIDDALNGDTVLDGSRSPATFIHLLTSVERFGPLLIGQDGARVAKELLLIVAKNLPNVTVFAFLALGALFRQKADCEGKDNQEESDEKVHQSTLIPQADLGKLLQALLRHELPDDAPNELTIAYTNCMTDGTIAYSAYHLHSPPKTEYVVKPVERLFNAMDPTDGRTNVTRSITVDLRRLLCHRWFQSKPAIFSLLQSFTGNAYRLQWPETTPVLKRYLEDNLTAGNPKMKGAIDQLTKAMVIFREKAIADNDRRAQEMVKGILSSIAKGGGAERILSVVELRYDRKLHVMNPWVLPILRENLCGAPLSLFTSQLMPLADHLETAAKKAALQNRVVEAKNAGIYISQIWGLLPGFCNKPSDLGQDGVLTTAFKAIHFCLSADDLVSMYSFGVGGLRQLSASILSQSPEDPTTKAKQASFGSRLKKLFPTIALVSEKVSDDRRGLILDAVVSACRATNDPTLVSSLLRKTIRRLLEAQLSGPKSAEKGLDTMVDDENQAIRSQHATADLAIALAESGIVPRDAAEIGFLEKAMSPLFLDPKQSSLQKKAYRATSLLVSLGAMATNRVAFAQFVKNTSEAGSTVAPGAKASRQGLVLSLVNHRLSLDSDCEKLEHLKMLNDGFLSEVMLGTRDTSEKTRTASFGTLVAMARAWNVSTSDASMSGLRQFFMAVAAGLGGKTVSMLSATLTSLGRLIYDFRGEASIHEDFAGDIDSLFASTICSADEDSPKMETDDGNSDKDEMEKVIIQPGPIAILLRHNAFEVQKSALGVVKIATKALATPPSRLVDVLPGILPGLVHVAARSKKQETRLRVRVILERLLRKCGREVLEANFPQEHIKLLAAVRKRYSRDLIKKHAAKEKRKDIQVTRTQREQAFQEQYENEESDNEFGLDESDSDVERELLDGDDLLSSQRRVIVNGSSVLQVTEKEGDVMDLLDTKNSHSVLTQGDVKEASVRARLEQSRKRKGKRDDVIKYTDDGRPIFTESDGDSGEAERGSINNDDHSESDDYTTGNSKPKQSGSGSVGKRRRHEPGEGSRHAKKSKGSFGEEYRSRRGSGDIKRAGRPDPYAYIPLGANMLGSKPGSAPRKGKQTPHGSSLHKLARQGGKKKGRRVGVPGKR